MTIKHISRAHFSSRGVLVTLTKDGHGWPCLASFPRDPVRSGRILGCSRAEETRNFGCSDKQTTWPGYVQERLPYVR